MIVFLVGMPACGKSRVGRRLAKKMAYNFIDLDKYLVSAEQKTIAKIFSTEGENYFRALETKYLAEISKTTENTVISVGGGAPCFNKNMQLMLATGKVFYLNTPIKTLAQRVQKNTKRPMFIGLSAEEIEQKLISLFAEREKFYLQANYHINTFRKSDERILDEIVLNVLR